MTSNNDCLRIQSFLVPLVNRIESRLIDGGFETQKHFCKPTDAFPAARYQVNVNETHYIIIAVTDDTPAVIAYEVYNRESYEIGGIPMRTGEIDFIAFLKPNCDEAEWAISTILESIV